MGNTEYRYDMLELNVHSKPDRSQLQSSTKKAKVTKN